MFVSWNTTTDKYTVQNIESMCEQSMLPKDHKDQQNNNFN